MNPKLAEFADLKGQVPAEKIAEISGLTVEEVEAAWADVQPKKASASKKAPAPNPAPKPAVLPTEIRLRETIRVAVQTRRGRKVAITIPKGIYRGERVAQILAVTKPGQVDILR